MAKSHQSYTPPILFIVPNSNIWPPLERCSSSCFSHRHLSNAALRDSMKNTLKTCITLVKNPSVKRESFRIPCEPICLKFSKDVAQLLFVHEKKKIEKKKKPRQSFLSTEQFRLHINKGWVYLSECLFFFPCFHLRERWLSANQHFSLSLQRPVLQRTVRSSGLDHALSRSFSFSPQ